MHKAQHGTIIQGTLNPRALLKAFTDELEALIKDATEVDPLSLGVMAKLVEEARVILRTWEDGPVTESDFAYIDEVISDLTEALNQFAPEGHYFGSREGDGADIGFWVNCDA